MFSKGLLSARHSITFDVLEQPPSWASTSLAQRQPLDTPSAQERPSRRGTSEPLTRGSISSLCVHGLLFSLRISGSTLWVGGRQPPRFGEARSSFFGKSRSLPQEFSSHHLLPTTPVPPEGLDVESQLSSWGQGTPRRFQTWLFAFSLSQAVVTPLYQDTLEDLALCKPVSWGFPQSVALSGLQAARQ